MTVAELRHYLSTLPDDMPVLTRGYEDGYESPLQALVTHAHEYPRDKVAWYYGNWNTEGLDPREEDKPLRSLDCLILR